MPDFLLKPGDLLFVKGDNILDRGIETISHSLYSHVAGYVAPGELIEAQGFRKTGYQSLTAYEGQTDVYRCDAIHDLQRIKIVRYAQMQLGDPYDYGLILIEALRYLFRWIIPWQEGQSKICSTLWNDAYQSVGVSLCPGIKYPSPGDLAQSKLLRKVGSY